MTETAGEKTEQVKSDATKDPKPLFRDIDADDDDPEVIEMESLCLNCEAQGTTRIFLTKIPFFKEVIVSSFSCESCGVLNSELQPGGKIQEKGVKYSVKIKNQKDLNRQVVQTNSATVSIPELQFEIPPNKGVLTTVEGILDKAIEGLSQDQPLRKIQHPEAAAQIEQFIQTLQNLRAAKQEFTIVLDDPSGNSFVENPHAPSTDPAASVHHYTRTKEQNEMLGIYTEVSTQETNEDATEPTQEQFTGKDEVMVFRDNCPHCQSPCDTNMKVVDIPHFKEVVIMSTNCEFCGVKENEVKGAAGIEPKGTKIKLKITDVSDLSRDVLKSETCTFSVPELDFTAQAGTMGGKFTTVEGIFVSIKDQLVGDNPFMTGDSSDGTQINKIRDFCGNFDKIISGEMSNIHIILDDPAGNSYLQNVYAPDDDPEMEVVHYERSYEQNDELGLNDMNTENYRSDS